MAINDPGQFPMGLPQLEQLSQAMARLGIPQRRRQAMDPTERHAQTIQNQLRRLAAVGVEPPPPAHEAPSSALERIFDVLSTGGRFVRQQVLPAVGIHGVQDIVEEGGLKGFLADLATDPLTYMTLGVGGVVRGAAAAGARQLPRMAIRAQIPFITRTAELAIPGTEGIAQTALAVSRNIGRMAEPALRPVRRAFNVISAPLGASETYRQQISVIEDAVKRVMRSSRRVSEDVADSLHRMDLLRRNAPEHVKVLGAMAQDDPSAARVFLGKSPREIELAVERIQHVANTITNHARQRGLDPMQASRLVYRSIPMLQNMQRLMQDAAQASGRRQMRMQLRARTLQVEFRNMFQSEMANLDPQTQQRMQAFLRSVLKQVASDPDAAMPRVGPMLATRQLPRLGFASPSEIRLAAAQVAEGGEGSISRMIQSVAQEAVSNPTALREGFSHAEKIRKELDRLASEWQRLERSAGLDYEAVLDYLPHLYTDHPDRVRRIMGQVLESHDRMFRQTIGKHAQFTKRRTFQTLMDGVMHGLTPQWDPATIAATRELYSVRARSVTGLEKVLRAMAKDEGPDALVRRIFKPEDIPEGWQAAGRYLRGLTGYAVDPEIAHALQQLKTNVFDPNSLTQQIGLLSYYARLFKPMALSRPGYFMRTVLGETFNMLLAGTPIWKIPLLVARATRILRTPISPRHRRDVFLRAGLDEIAAIGAEGPITVAQLREFFKDEALHGFGFRGEVGARAVQRMLDQIVNEARDIHVSLGEALRTGRIGETKLFAKTTRKAAEGIESVFKMAAVLDELDQGGSLLQAANRARKYHFDYGDVTGIEHRLRMGLVPFFVWTRKELPLLVESIYKRPQVYLALGYAHEAGLRSLEIDPDQMPDWLRANLAIPTPGFIVNTLMGDAVMLDLPTSDNKGRPVFTSLGLPTDMFGQMTSVTDTMRRFGIGMLSPVAQVPIELMTGTQAFTGAPLPRREFATEPFLGMQIPQTVAHTLNQLLGGLTPFIAGMPLVSDPGILGALGFDVPEGVEPETIPPRMEDPAFSRLLRVLGMSSLAVPVQPERQRVIQEMLYARRLTDLISHLQRDRGIVVPTIAELQGGTARPDSLRTMLQRLRALGPVVSNR